jgi:Tfp pilus assembly protein FimT
MTLVELLVVIVLVTTLVTTVIPIISPGGDNKRLREASRNLNAYLQGAQARAIETGRPFGVAFQRLSADTDRGADNAVSIRAEYVEVPPHYSGVNPTSAVRIARNPNYNPSAAPPANVGTVWVQFVHRGPTMAGMPPGWTADLTPPAFFRPGDTLEVHGQRYTLLDNPGGQPPLRAVGGYFPPSSAAPGGLVTLLATPEGTPPSQPIDLLPALPAVYDSQGNKVGDTTSPVAPFWTTPTPYRVYRQPVPAGGEPLEMPGGVAVDLQASVFTNRVRLFVPSQAPFDSSAGDFRPLPAPVMVLFSPEGNIDRIYFGSNAVTGELISSSVTSTLALCVGRRELIPPKPTERAAALSGTQKFDEPINLQLDVLDRNLSETEAKDLMDQYNWLNLDSRWVLVGGQSGSVSTIANSAVFPSPATALVADQLAAAIANASSRTTAGGR